MTTPALSYELYPPASDAATENFWNTVAQLELTAPDHVALTYGAGGRNHRVAFEVLAQLLTTTRLRPLAHLTCIGESEQDLRRTIDELLNLGVRGVLALRGDRPGPDSPLDPERPDGVRYASDFVSLIRDVETENVARLCGGRMAIGVAAYPDQHPESATADQDILVLRAKQDAGADFAITQVFFDTSRYTSLLQRARAFGITMPIIPGVIPLVSPRRLNRLAQLSGVQPPRELLHELETASTPAEQRRIGVRATVEAARAALDAGAPGLHLYTFNEHTAALDVLEALDLPRPAAPPSVVSRIA